MDSQFVSILIGIGFVVGMPLLEKLLDKIKQGKHHGVSSAPPRRQETHAKRQTAQPHMPKKAKAPVLSGIEGVRVTDDSAFSPYSTTDRYHAADTTTDNGQSAPVSRDNLRKAVIWSEILNNPKFKES
ncbi:MAG: hypothetical protein J6C95_01500 [Muribaculaceae bacterium]|nr:hypothetical protein [Muribaculaceae bacterium]